MINALRPSARLGLWGGRSSATPERHFGWKNGPKVAFWIIFGSKTVQEWTRGIILDHFGLKNGPKMVLGGTWGPPGAYLGSIFGSLGGPWGPEAVLHQLLHHFWSHLGGHLGSIWGSILGPFWVRFRGRFPGRFLDPSGHPVGPIWGPFRGHFGVQNAPKTDPESGHRKTPL